MSKLREQIREARLVRVLLVYLGASWAVLEATALMRDELGLPSWVIPLAAILLLVGLVIITTTAWIQAHPITRLRADELPSPWEVDLVDLGQSVAKGRLPHLTWARAILGGVFAFSLLFGFAGLYVLLTGRAPNVPGPREAVAAAAPRIAVLPFRTVGPELELWREGMVDLLATNLDGAGGFRTSDPRTLLNRWRSQVGQDDSEPDLEVALRVAEGVGASYAIMGSAVDLGGGVRLSADIYDIDSGESVGRAQIEGASDSVMVLVDRLSIAIVQQIAPFSPNELPEFDVREITTTSLPALKAYLEGEQKYRRGAWAEAIEHYLRALDADSSFALAHLGVAQAYGWTEAFSERVFEFSHRAAEYTDRLPERAALLVRANLEIEELRVAQRSRRSRR